MFSSAVLAMRCTACRADERAVRACGVYRQLKSRLADGNTFCFD
jgi:hypothetical protein